MRNSGFALSTVSFLLFVAAGCSKSGGGSAATPTPTPTPANTAPSVALGTLTASAISQTALTLGWAPAYDAETAAASLSYQVYVSTQNDIATLSDVLANGTALGASVTGAYSLHVDSLSPSTDYWFNVVVSDAENAQVAYSALEVATADPTMVIFPAPGLTNGGFGGRAGADAFCSGVSALPVYASLQCSQVRAFVGTGAGTGAINEMPSLYGVPTDRKIVGPTGVLIANDWADLLDGSIANSIEDATGLGVSYWTGSDANGDGSNACFSGGTWNLTSGGAGRTGDPAATGSGWLVLADPDCSEMHALLCLCY